MNFMVYIQIYNMSCLGSDAKNIISYQQISKGKKKKCRLVWSNLSFIVHLEISLNSTWNIADKLKSGI